MLTNRIANLGLLAAMIAFSGCKSGGSGRDNNNNPGGDGGPAQCGNNVADGPEICDGSDLRGETCQSRGFGQGELACRLDCALDTTDCSGSATCGNGTVDFFTEECDGSDMDNQSCATQGFASGTLGCTLDCIFDTSGCVPAVCGDGVLEGNEECEGSDFGGEDCITFGHGGGTLLCDNCFIDDSQCTADFCGNGITGAAEECDDGNQNPGDGCSPACQAEYCGNGVLDPGEGCDDGNFNCHDDCTCLCENAICGDGVIHIDGAGGEACDDGNADNGDLCANDCSVNAGFEDCTNGSDDNGNGDVDCADAACGLHPACVERLCEDGVDNDGNGDTDCDDIGCEASLACTTAGVWEVFSGDNDLDGVRLTWVPAPVTPAEFVWGHQTGVTAYVDLPGTGTLASQTFTLTDNDFAQYSFAAAVGFPFFGTTYVEIYVGSNGYVTFTGGDVNSLESAAGHFDQPRISVLFDDLDPGLGGTITVDEFDDRVVVTWDGIEGFQGPNQFQVIMRRTGIIEVVYLSLSEVDGLVGLSAGEIGQVPFPVDLVP